MTNLQDFTNRSEVGAIKPWTKATAPAGYLLCNGAAVSRTTYADLYAVTSTTYGAGDGSTTFNVPQLQGKTPQGYDGNTYNLAATGGANTVTVAMTNNQAVGATSTVANNQAVTVTGAISNTSVSEAQLASHTHLAGSSGTPNPAGNVVKIHDVVQQSQVTLPLTYLTGTNYPSQLHETKGSGTGHTHAHTLAGTLTGTVAVTTTGTLTGTVAAAGTNSFSPFVVVNYIIKH
jgi:microcystin-dependent protein|tara:strand:- start:155 stop:850 length:696 start_codon:yes stop_codon:yes gene_type:complete